MENKYFFKSIVLAFITSVLYFIVDYLNIIRSRFSYDDKFVITIIIILCILFIGFVSYTKIYKGLISKEYNLIDYIICYIFVLASLLIISNILCEHKIIINFIFIIISLIFIIFRMIKILSYKEINIEKHTNLYRLKDLYENKLNKQKIIILEERELEDEEYDILDLSFVRRNLINFITECNPYHCFVLGLIGEWGIGKSSTIRLVNSSIQNNNNILIKSFDPWVYNNNNDLMEGFCELLSSSFKLDTQVQYQIEAAFKKYRRLLLEILDEKIGTNLFDSKTINEDIDNQRNIINSLIEKSPMKRIFVIDNLDRINKDQLYFFFNIINNLLNFNRIIIILCYDESILNDMLSEDNVYGKNYMDKIVNSKIYMPFLDKNTMQDIGKKCIENLLEHYNIPIKYKYEFNNTISVILDSISNLRDLIRFINTLSSNIDIVSQYNLYINDFIALEYIKYSNNELYKFIYNNSYILCTDIEYFEGDLKLQFDNFMSLGAYRYLLSYLFDLKSNKEYYRESNNENRCKDFNVISTYFSQKETISLKITNEVMNLIDKINYQSLLNNDKSLVELCSKYKAYDVLTILYKNVDKVKNSTNLLKLLIHFDFSSEICTFLDYILEKENINKVKILLRILKQNNMTLFIMYSNHYINKYFHPLSKENLYTYIKNNLIETSNECFSKMISIFTYNEFNYHILYILLQYTTLSTDIIREYFNNNIVTPSSVFRVIASFITEIISEKQGYSYIVEYDNIVKYIDLDLLDKCLNNTYDLNLDQRKILRIFNSKSLISYKKQIDFSNL